MKEKWFKEARKLITYLVEDMPKHLDSTRESLLNMSEIAADERGNE